MPPGFLAAQDAPKMLTRGMQDASKTASKTFPPSRLRFATLQNLILHPPDLDLRPSRYSLSFFFPQSDLCALAVAATFNKIISKRSSLPPILRNLFKRANRRQPDQRASLFGDLLKGEPHASDAQCSFLNDSFCRRRLPSVAAPRRPLPLTPVQQKLKLNSRIGERSERAHSPNGQVPSKISLDKYPS